MFMLDVWGEMEQFYEDEISKKRFNQMTGDPAEPQNLSVSIDWKLMRKQRKIKIKDLRDEVNQGIVDKFKEINNRNNLVGQHDQNKKGNLKKSIIGVLPGD